MPAAIIGKQYAFLPAVLMVTALDAAALRRAMLTFADALRAHRDEINSLNVYPVPDGDTGTNLLLTQESVVAALDLVPPADGLRPVGETVAKASLIGARGNSGVILSQALRGMCEDMPKAGSVGPAEVAARLVRAAEEAHRAVASPAEGTMLSVLRDAARAGMSAAEGDGDLPAVIEAALEAARRSLADTPQLLPELQRAGVVDAGGKGIVLLLDALRATMTGDGLSEPVAAFGPVGRGAAPDRRPGLQAEVLDHPFEVQFLLEAEEDGVAALRRHLRGLGESLVMVGGGGLYNVHIHTAQPDVVVESGRDAGPLRHVSIASLQGQVSACLAGQARAVRVAEQPAQAGCALVAVAEGPGLVRLFASLGAVVVPGGPGNNPSVRDLVAAMSASGADGVIVLPNHRNVIPAAERAVAAVGPMGRLVPAASIPAGIAAATAFNALAPVEVNEASAREAARQCRSGELVRAERDARTPDGQIGRGQWMAMADGVLVCTGGTAAEGAAEIVRRLAREDAEIVTVIVGAPATAAEREEVEASLRATFPALQVDVVEGGQPRYPFLIGVE
jgi:DAK2 domain fusion protein YloV